MTRYRGRYQGNSSYQYNSQLLQYFPTNYNTRSSHPNNHSRFYSIAAKHSEIVLFTLRARLGNPGSARSIEKLRAIVTECGLNVRFCKGVNEPLALNSVGVREARTIQFCIVYGFLKIKLAF